MKKRIKSMLALLFIVTLCLQLTACGKKDNQDNSQTAEYVYVPEYIKLQLEEETYMEEVAVIGSDMYYILSTYDETTDTSIEKLYRVALEQNAVPEELLIRDGNSYVSTMCTDREGNLILIARSIMTGNEEGDNAVITYGLQKIGKDGTILAEYDISDMIASESEYPYVQDAVVDEEGNIYLTNNMSMIWVVNPEGKELFRLPLNDWIDSIACTKGGRVVVSSYDNGVKLKTIDAAAKTWGDSVDITNTRGSIYIAPGIEKECLVSNGEEVLEYDFSTQAEPTHILNWLDMNINSQYIKMFSPLEDGRIFVQTWDYSQQAQNEVILLSKKAASEVVQKETIVLATLYANQDIKAEAIAFNKANPNYQIKIKEYDSEDNEAAMIQLNADLVSGTGIDIIDISNGSYMKSYGAKGLLEDLNLYLEQDAELKKEDFVQSVLNIYSQNGKLYGIPTTFSINTVIGKASELGNKQGWTLEEYMEYANSQPEDVEVAEYQTKSDAFSECFNYNMDRFINWETGECSLNTDEFIQILEFANQFPEEFQWEEGAPSTPEKIQSGKLKLLSVSLDNVHTYQMYSNMFENDVTFIGYPTTDSTGIAVSPNGGIYGICSKSEKKEAAWEFLRGLYLEDSQKSADRWGFSVNRNVLEEQMQEAMKIEYVTDENGEPELDEDGNPIETEKTSWNYDGWETKIYAATQEQVDAVKALIDSADMSYQSDSEIDNIMTEELEAFFKGQKTAAEVADIVQSRVKIYVNESR